MKQFYILTGVLMCFFSIIPTTHPRPLGLDRCASDKAIEVCRAKIPDAEERAKIKTLFGYPSNRYNTQGLKNKNFCDNPNSCLAYLTTLKTIESEYQACQYAKKKIPKEQERKVQNHLKSMGTSLGTNHIRNRQSDELRWLTCNYIVACENGLTLYGQETKSLCK